MKQIIIVRTDLKMNKGKIAGQVAHASIGAYRQSPEKIREEWFSNHIQTKIVLKVTSEKELYDYYNKAIENGLNAYVVRNLTEDKWKNELTCMGVGPAINEKLDNIFNDLKLL